MEFIYSTNTFYKIGEELKKPCLAKIVKRKNKREKGLKTTGNMAGITLVALVVTIVILLILAGVTTNLILGEGGIINKAQEAVNRTNNAVKEEENRLNELLNILEQETGGEEEPEDEIVEPENIDDWEWRVETAETTDDPKYIGTITILKYKGSATEIIVPNHINGVPVKRLGGEPVLDDDFWITESFLHHSLTPELVFWGTVTQARANSTITRVVISKGIEIIGDQVFLAMKGLKEVIIPNTVTKIGSDVFTLTYLDYYYIPASVLEIGGYAFGGTKLGIYCGATEKPEGWDENWDVQSNNQHQKVYWNIKDTGGYKR